MNEKKTSSLQARCLYQPGELEDSCRCVTDPVLSLKVFDIERTTTKIRTNKFFTICVMAPNGILSAKDCWLCPVSLNYSWLILLVIEMVLYGLCVASIWQHPPLVVIGAQAYFFSDRMYAWFLCPF